MAHIMYHSEMFIRFYYAVLLVISLCFPKSTTLLFASSRFMHRKSSDLGTLAERKCACCNCLVPHGWDHRTGSNCRRGTLQQEVTSAVFRGASTKKCNHCMQICTCNRNQSRATICMVMVCYGYLMLFVWFFLIFLLRTTQAFLCLNVVVNGSTDIKPVFWVSRKNLMCVPRWKAVGPCHAFNIHSPALLLFGYHGFDHTHLIPAGICF